LHTFLLVPVGFGVDIAESQMVAPDEYERILNWFYDQAAQGDLELKDTCAPEPKQESNGAAPAQPAIGATEMTMPGSTGIAFTEHPHGHPGGDPNAMNAMPQGCLAGTGVRFLSFDGEVFPCGYLPAIAGDLRKESFADIWNHAAVFADLRDTEKLEGKCGCCEFRNVCMGCRARAYAANGNYMAEEPFCVYEPKAMAHKE